MKNVLKQLTKERIENTFAILERDDSKMKKVFDNLEYFRDKKILNEKYIKKWESILLLPLSEIKDLLLQDNEDGELLRTTTIFIGIK